MFRYLLLLLTSLPILLWAQVPEKEDWVQKLRFYPNTVILPEDTLVYLSSIAPDALSPDTTVIFIQGSLPKPLIIVTPQGPAGVFPFNHYPYLKNYRFIIISKPG
ncbi:MAG: hypothetical protein AAFV07_02025, partial [Bacteroidota bacterium]